MTSDRARSLLTELDSEGYRVIEALTHAKVPPVGSHASPHSFVAIDSRTYWIKRNAQQGLMAELAAGRLGYQVGAAPNARVVRLTAAAAPADGSCAHLLGIGVGIEDQPGMENIKHITTLRPDGTLDPTTIDPSSRAMVVVFHTWLGMSDAQILVDLRTGSLKSIDHGDWCPDPAARVDPVVVETPGVPADFGRSEDLIEPAVDRIEGVSNEDLVRALAQAPSDPDWNTSSDRRLAIAEWLAWRRDRLREVMATWWTTAPANATT